MSTGKTSGKIMGPSDRRHTQGSRGRVDIDTVIQERERGEEETKIIVPLVE